MRKRRKRVNYRLMICLSAILAALAVGVALLFPQLQGEQAEDSLPANSPQNALQNIEPPTKSPRVTKAPATKKPIPYENDEYLMLINESFPNPNHGRPNNLVLLCEVFGDEVNLQIPDGSIELTTALAAKQMFIDARSQGIDGFIITTAYRSREFQRQLYEEFIMREHFPDERKVQPDFASEHPTGLALDILCLEHNYADEGFFETKHGKWLYNNAHKYGFILRYPKGKEHITGVMFEPWHYRYVGKEAAASMKESGECLEEFLGLA